MKFSNASKRSVQGFDKRSSRKKWSLAVALLALLVLAGCNKASTAGGDENGSEKGSENGATKQMSQEELVQLM